MGLKHVPCRLAYYWRDLRFVPYSALRHGVECYVMLQQCELGADAV